MGTACYVLADEDFILSLLTNSSLRDKYQKYTFSDHVKVSVYLLIMNQVTVFTDCFSGSCRVISWMCVSVCPPVTSEPGDLLPSYLALLIRLGII